MVPSAILPQAEESGYPPVIYMQLARLTLTTKCSEMNWFHHGPHESSPGTPNRGIVPN